MNKLSLMHILDRTLDIEATEGPEWDWVRENASFAHVDNETQGAASY